MAKILLVEDNEMNRDMLSRRLKRRGFDMVIAIDGQEGLEMAGQESPDLVLLDLSLPKVDGWDVARQLKADATTSGIPIIALTAHAMAGDREKGYEPAPDGVATGEQQVRQSEAHDARFYVLGGVGTARYSGSRWRWNPSIIAA